jgi:cysteinyl-tRNA synthetase
MLKIYNTLARSVEEFKPIDPNNVRIYSCGPTVYGAPHIGNMRKYVLDDLLKNTLKHICGYHTTHVVNITDVGHLTDDGDHGEDKMEKWARREWLTARDVAKRYEELFHENCRALLLAPFDVTPRATDHIVEQIEMIRQLEAKWYTYIIPDDGVYMNTSKVKDYAVLVRQKHIDWLNKWARIEDNGKKNITDFALRKFNTTGKKRDMERDSPWWIGFPGWHIECSAMSIKYLGNHFDIHTGGIDHIPIHHTNEIAQSQCSCADTPWVNYRVHYQFLNIDGKKISKSLGNVITLDEIFERWYSAEDLRYFFFQANYRSFQDFTRESLEAASKGRKKLKLVSDESYPRDDVVAPLLDDLNTPIFLANIQKHGISEKLNAIYKLYKPEEQIVQEKIPSDIQQLAEQRRQAKLNKDRTTADQMRDQLTNLGREMNDGKDGYEIVKV